jgi:predicted nucleic acid-binding protein
VIYLDSCALIKLAVEEPESGALRAWLAERPDIPRLSSSIIRVEVPRSILRRQPGAVLQARSVVAKTRRVAMTAEVLEVATMFQPTTLRSLDAIHLASAFVVHDRLTAFVSYDQRLLDAARAAGLPTAAPA